MKKGLLGALLLAACLRPVVAADLYVTWTCSVAGDLSAGAQTVLFGSIRLGGDRIFHVDANFILPDAFVGNGTGRPEGTVNIVCEVLAPAPYVIDGLTVDLLGLLVPGLFATSPRIEWNERIYDISNDEPILLIVDSGVDRVQPTTRTYRFAPSSKIRIEETFFLTGVTYRDGNETLIDQGASVSLPLVEKQVHLIPEPSSAAILAGLLGGLVARRRRK